MDVLAVSSGLEAAGGFLVIAVGYGTVWPAVGVSARLRARSYT
jgi:hypothetical protein